MSMTVQTVTTTKHFISGSMSSPFLQAVIEGHGAKVKFKPTDALGNPHHDVHGNLMIRTSEECAEWEELFRTLRLKLRDIEVAELQNEGDRKRQIDDALNGGSTAEPKGAITR